MQDPVAIRAEGDALLLGLFDGLFEVVLFEDEIVHGAFVMADHVVEVDHRGMGETAVRTGLFGAVVEPRLFDRGAAGAALFDGVLGVLQIPTARVLALPFAADFVVFEGH